MALAPLLAVVGGALVVLLAEAFLRKKDSEIPAALALASLLAAGFFTVVSWSEPGLSAFGGRLLLDPLARFLIIIFIVLGVFVALMGLKYAARMGLALGPLCGLLLLAVAGLIIMVSTRDWLIVFLGLEVLSVASYALT
ncbi:MAG TPA: hypothetical protein VLJ16_14480, partial [Acidobacteriota bacterium]|nr:hypothetical protein [Acidobacteriota bacterium]